MKWHDLPKRAQVELSNLVPPDYQLDVIRDNPEALAKVFRLIRNQWQECDKILEEEGERGLAKERDRVAKQMEELERGPAYLRQRLRELNYKLAQETHRHGWEDGRKATPAEVAAVSDYAAHLVEEWMRYEKMRQDGYLLDLNEQMHHRRIRLSIIKEVLHRKENFLPTEVPDFVQKALKASKPDPDEQSSGPGRRKEYNVDAFEKAVWAVLKERKNRCWHSTDNRKFDQPNRSGIFHAISESDEHQSCLKKVRGQEEGVMICKRTADTAIEKILETNPERVEELRRKLEEKIERHEGIRADAETPCSGVE